MIYILYLSLVAQTKHTVGKVVQAKLIRKSKAKTMRIEVPMTRGQYINAFGSSGYIPASGQ